MDSLLDNINNTSIVKTLLLFYVLIGSSLLEPLLSKQWKQMIKDNRLIQHVIAFTILMSLMTMLSNNKLSNLNIIIYSLFAYLWFLFSTKMDIHWIAIMMVLLLVAYMYENSLNNKDIKAFDDKVLTSDEKKLIIENNNYKKMYFMLGLIIITIIGVTLYSNKKEVQYGGGEYSLIKFLLY